MSVIFFNQSMINTTEQ